jgi:hypothetical protein
MSVEEIGSIDVISTDEHTGQVILTVSDHLDWHDNLKHQKVLEAKLNAYLRFVESGEILHRHPAPKGRRITICVVFRFQPDQEALHFLAQVRRVVESAGIAFRYELFAVSYEN